MSIIETPPAYSNIHKNLWLGSHPSASGTDHEKFHVIFAFDGRPSYNIYMGQTVIVHPFDDVEHIPKNLEFYLHGLANQVIALAREDGQVLLHCQGGINRSALVMGIVLIILGYTAPAAIALMREKRSPIVLMNKTFEQYLLDYDYNALTALFDKKPVFCEK